MEVFSLSLEAGSPASHAFSLLELQKGGVLSWEEVYDYMRGKFGYKQVLEGEVIESEEWLAYKGVAQGGGESFQEYLLRKDLAKQLLMETADILRATPYSVIVGAAQPLRSYLLSVWTARAADVDSVDKIVAIAQRYSLTNPTRQRSGPASGGGNATVLAAEVRNEHEDLNGSMDSASSLVVQQIATANATSAAATNGPLEQLQMMMAQLMKDQQFALAQIAELRAGTSNAAGRASGIRCWHCNEEGHASRDCNKPCHSCKGSHPGSRCGKGAGAGSN